MWDSFIKKTQWKTIVENRKSTRWSANRSFVQYKCLQNPIGTWFTVAQHVSQLWLLILSSLHQKGSITWDAVDWTGLSECCRTAYYSATLCFHASTWEGEGRYDIIVFWLAQNFYWRSIVWVWEREEASLYDCLLIFTLLFSLTFLILTVWIRL
jgi:hypothetical protein